MFSLGELSKADEGATAERHRGLMTLKLQDDLRLVFWGFFFPTESGFFLVENNMFLELLTVKKRLSEL